MRKVIVGLVGTIGSGKSSVAAFLVKKGFVNLRFSAEIEKEITKRKLSFERKAYQDIGNEWRSKRVDFISQRLLKIIAKLPNNSKIVIEGARNPGEIYPFKKSPGFCLIGLDAPAKIRFQRVNKLSRDPKTWAEFMIGEKRDLGIGEPESGQNNRGCLELADIIISTDKVKSKVQAEVWQYLQQKKLV